MFSKIKLAEAKVKASALASFAVIAVLTGWLSTTATDFVSTLPDWAEVPALSLIGSAVVFLSGYSKKTSEGTVAPSTKDAVERWLRERGYLRD